VLTKLWNFYKKSYTKTDTRDTTKAYTATNSL